MLWIFSIIHVRRRTGEKKENKTRKRENKEKNSNIIKLPYLSLTDTELLYIANQHKHLWYIWASNPCLLLVEATPLSLIDRSFKIKYMDFVFFNFF